MALVIPDYDTLNLSDGTTLRLSKTPNASDAEWKETKRYLEDNPEEARRMESFSKDAKAVKSWMQQQAIQEHYQMKINTGDEVISSKIDSLDKNPDFAHIFEDVRRSGAQAAMQYYYNEPLMLKMSRAMGGIPEDVKDNLAQIQKDPVTLQEACKMGNAHAVEEYLRAGGSRIDEPDAKGVTGLGYAIGANRTAVVKMLLEKKADPANCDSSGGSGLHYAAAYGRKELLDFLLKSGLPVNAKNTLGMTPLALATKNNMKEAIDLLKAKGGQM